MIIKSKQDAQQVAKEVFQVAKTYNRTVGIRFVANVKGIMGGKTYYNYNILHIRPNSMAWWRTFSGAESMYDFEISESELVDMLWKDRKSYNDAVKAEKGEYIYY